MSKTHSLSSKLLTLSNIHLTLNIYSVPDYRLVVCLFGFLRFYLFI